MKFKYIGDDEAPEETNYRGMYIFVRGGEFVDVTDPVCVIKLTGDAGFISLADELEVVTATVVKESKKAKRRRLSHL